MQRIALDRAAGHRSVSEPDDRPLLDRLVLDAAAVFRVWNGVAESGVQSLAGPEVQRLVDEVASERCCANWCSCSRRGRRRLR